MNRGSSAQADGGGSIASRFNEAPIHESGKYDGRGPDRGWRQSASMRPRFMNRGSSAYHIGSALVSPASMRPRFMNRGSAAEISCERSAIWRLQ